MCEEMDDFDYTRINFDDPIDPHNDGVHVKSESMLYEPNEYPYFPSHEEVYGHNVRVQSIIQSEPPEQITDFVFADTHQWLTDYAAICCSVVNNAAVSSSITTNPAIRLPPDPKSIA